MKDRYREFSPSVTDKKVFEGYTLREMLEENEVTDA
jgi:hypothetical protein